MEPNNGEVYGPDKDDRITHVVAIELLSSSEWAAEALVVHVRAALAALGLVEHAHYEITYGSPTDMIKATRLPAEFISPSQKGYLNHLLGQVSTLIRKLEDVVDPDNITIDIARRGLEIITNERDGDPVSKRRASELIDFAKESVENLTAELNEL